MFSPRLALAEYEVGVCGAAQTRGAGDHVHGIVVIPFSQVVDQQDGNAVTVRQRFENADVPVVASVGSDLITGRADALGGCR